MLGDSFFGVGDIGKGVVRPAMIIEGVLIKKSDATTVTFLLVVTRCSIDITWVVSNIYLINIQRYVESIQNFAQSLYTAAKKLM